MQTAAYSQYNALYWFNQGVNASSDKEKIEFYTRAVQMSPNFIEAYFNLGRAYKNLGQLTEAENAFKKALTCNPGQLQSKIKQTILYELGLVAGKLGRYEDAEVSLLDALKITNDNSLQSMILYHLGLVNMLMGRYQKAITFYEQGINVYPVNQASFEKAIDQAKGREKIENYYSEGLNLLAQNQPDQAITAFEKVAKIDPDYKDTKQLFEETKSRLKNKTDDSNIQKRYAQGVTHLENKEWQSAIQAFEEVLQKSPNYEKAQEYITFARYNFDSTKKNESFDRYYEEGLAAAQRGDYIKAFITLERIKKQDPNFKDVNLLLRQFQKKFEEQNDQSTKNNLYNRGLIAFEAEKWEEALEIFNRLYALDSNYKDVQYMINSTRQKMDEAASVQSIDIYYQNGLDYMRKGDWLNALINFEKVKMIDSDYKQVNLYLSQTNLNYEKSQQGIAKKEATVATKINPLFIAGIVMLVLALQFGGIILLFPTARARFYLLQRKYDKAREIYERILNYHPEKIKLYITLANIYITENRKDEVAVRVFEKVIESNLDENLKHHLIPVVNHYYNQKQLPIRSIDDSLKAEIKNMGN